MPNLRESKLYSILVNKSLEDLQTECYNQISTGKDVNVQDSKSGETYLHCMCDRTDWLTNPVGSSVIYILASKGADLDIQDNLGETFLHKVVRTQGAYRSLIAAVRCGADMMVLDNRGRTAEDILLTEKPQGWQEMLHWWNKFKPGLYRETQADHPDIDLVERLLKSWCRTTIVKHRKEYSVKLRLRQREKDIDLVQLLEKYENSIELALAAISGKAEILRRLKKSIEDNPESSKSINANICDQSYQPNMDSPEVPLPLLACVWKMNKLDVTKLLLEYGADTSVLYSPNPAKEAVKPLFFQLICSEERPSKEIVYYSLHKSDLSAKNYKGQTLLYEAIKQKVSSSLFEFLLRQGIDVAARDKYGQTARDFAAQLNRRKYVHLIDQQVANMVKDCDIMGVESLILQGYDHILDIIDEKEELGVMNLAKLTGSGQLVEMLMKRGKSREHIEKMLRVAHKGRLAELRPLLGKRYLAAVDICGRNVCHIAVVNKRKEFIKYFCDHYASLLNKKDNLGRTPYHYAQLILQGDDITHYMLQKGADPKVKDVLGRCPSDYKNDKCGDREFFTLQRDVKNFSMDVYVTQTNFEKNLIRAIKKGRQKVVADLVLGLKNKPTDTEYLNRYSYILFICFDYKQEDIAIYLIKEGMNYNIFKQYDKSDAANPKCTMFESNDGPKLFKDVAKEKNCQRVLEFLNELNKDQDNMDGAKKVDCLTFAQFGLV